MSSPPTHNEGVKSLKMSPDSELAEENPQNSPKPGPISGSDPRQHLADDATEDKTDTTAASVNYRVIYLERDQKDSSPLEIGKGPFLEIPPPVYQDLSVDDDDDGEEGQDPEGGTVFDVMIYLAVRRLPGENSSEIPMFSMPRSDAGRDPENEISEEKTEENVFMGVNGQKWQVYHHEYTDIEVKSSAILEALKAVVKYHSKITFDGKPLILEEPYYLLLQHQEELSRFVRESVEAGKAGDARAKAMKLQKDFQALETFLNARWSKKIERELVRYQQDPPVATFEMLWMLLKPGIRVFASEEQGPLHRRGGFVVRSIRTYPDFDSYKLSLWRFAFIGSVMFRTKYCRWIDPFDGEREIRKLAIYPTELKVGDRIVQLDPELKETLEERGEKYWKFVRQIMQRGSFQVNYDGPVGNQPRGEGSYTGRAILDPSLYQRNPRPSLPPPRVPAFIEIQSTRPKQLPNLDLVDTGSSMSHNDNVPVYEINDSKSNDQIEESITPEKGMWHRYENITKASLNDSGILVGKGHFFLCPPLIGGFLLKTRSFDILNVEFAHPCSIDETVIDSLQIPRSRLDMIKALTQKFEDKQKTWSADFIQNKGEGQIFLLHGPSGVGKTYTAECIAKLTGRPLLAITVADIGTDEADMEKSLAKWFKYSEAWEAIMLIDEADVYFERRGGGQLQRNSLVSAFLRSMEYYRGILFLTTNRLGHIDDAILSRIHLIIEYTDLSDEDRVKIWRQFFRKLETDRSNFKVDEYLEGFIENDPKIGALQWNGREIRNAFQTAVALAEYSAKTAIPPKEKVIITKKHLEGVVEMSGAFKKYMRDWKGDVDRRAFLDGSRMDQGMKIRREQLEMAREAARNSRVVRERP